MVHVHANVGWPSMLNTSNNLRGHDGRLPFLEDFESQAGVCYSENR